MATYLRILTTLPIMSACLLAAGIACGESAETDVIITRPAQGTTVEAGNVTVSVETKKFDVVDKLDQAANDGEGHVHFYIDVGGIPTVDGEPAITDEGTYHAQATTEFTWEDVEPGEHTFAVQLVNNDHTPLRPPVIAQVVVEVGGEGGEASPTGSPSRSPTPTEEETETPSGTTGGTSPTATSASTATSTPTPRPSPTATATP